MKPAALPEWPVVLPCAWFYFVYSRRRCYWISAERLEEFGLRPPLPTKRQ